MSSRVESSRVVSCQVELCRVVSYRIESCQVESSRQEARRHESSHIKSSRVELICVELSRVESCCVASTQHDTTRLDIFTSVYLMFVMVKRNFDYTQSEKRSCLDIRYPVRYQIDAESCKMYFDIIRFKLI